MITGRINQIELARLGVSGCGSRAVSGLETFGRRPRAASHELLFVEAVVRPELRRPVLANNRRGSSTLYTLRAWLECSCGGNRNGGSRWLSRRWVLLITDLARAHVFGVRGPGSLRRRSTQLSLLRLLSTALFRLTSVAPQT